jgi:hypothetical protein
LATIWQLDYLLKDFYRKVLMLISLYTLSLKLRNRITH